MKALTVYQPWATLIAIGAKPYEFRKWPAPAFVQGQRIGIHAAKRPIKLKEVWDIISRLGGHCPWETGLKAEIALPLLMRVAADPSILPRSSIVCTAVVGRPVNGFDIMSEFGGPVNDSARNEHAQWAWPMLEVEQLQPPTEALGHQGFWTWDGVL